MKILLITKSEFPPGVNLWQSKKSIIHLTLNFTTMKKSILILIVAIFAIGFSSSYGQVTCPVPRTVDPVCLPSDALHPKAGNPYNYTVVVPTPPGTKEYTWFVTQDQNFITGGILTANREFPIPSLHVAATGVGYNNPATGTATLSITWKYWVPDPALPVFVVINVRNLPIIPDVCISQNMKVFKIMPVNAFTLDIQNVKLDHTTPGYEVQIDRCIHDIVSAKYDINSPEGVIYDFGTDSLFYVVTAANFTRAWRPSVQLSGLDPNETVARVEWARPADFAFATPHAFTLTAGTWNANDSVLALNGIGVDSIGECILIRVTLDHSRTGFPSFQGLTDEVTVLAVDGMATGAVPDVHWSSTLPVVNAFCGLPDGFQFDLAQQTIKARPNITAPGMPAPGLLPVKP
jgi:hypothetical protein